MTCIFELGSSLKPTIMKQVKIIVINCVLFLGIMVSCTKELANHPKSSKQTVNPKVDAKLSTLIKKFNQLKSNPHARLSTLETYSFEDAKIYFENALFHAMVSNDIPLEIGHVESYPINDLFDNQDPVEEEDLLNLIDSYYNIIDEGLQAYSFTYGDNQSMSGTKFIALIDVRTPNEEFPADIVLDVVFGINTGEEASSDPLIGYAPFTDLGCGTLNDGLRPGPISYGNSYLNNCALNPNYRPTRCNDNTFGLTYDVIDYNFTAPVMNNIVVIGTHPQYPPYGPLWYGSHTDCWDFATMHSSTEDLETFYIAPTGFENILYMLSGSYDLSNTDPNYSGKGAYTYRDWIGIPKFIDVAPYSTPTYEQ